MPKQKTKQTLEREAKARIKEGVMRMVKDNFHPVMWLHRDDIEGQGFDTSSMDNEDIGEFASDVGESLMELFHTSVEVIAEEKNELPRG
jgi:hypothetical protein